MLQKLLDDAKLKNDKLERLYLDAKERNVVLEHAISKDITTSKGYVSWFCLKSSPTYNAIRSTNLGQEAHDELSKMRTKMYKLEAELANTRSKLTEATTNCKLSPGFRFSWSWRVKANEF